MNELLRVQATSRYVRLTVSVVLAATAWGGAVHAADNRSPFRAEQSTPETVSAVQPNAPAETEVDTPAGVDASGRQPPDGSPNAQEEDQAKPQEQPVSPVAPNNVPPQTETNFVGAPFKDPYENETNAAGQARVRVALVTVFAGAVWNTMGGADFDGAHGWEGGQGIVVLPHLSPGFGYLLGAGLYFGSPARGDRGIGGGVTAGYSQSFHDTKIGSSIAVEGNGSTSNAPTTVSDVGSAHINDFSLDLKVGWTPFEVPMFAYLAIPLGFSWVTSERGRGTHLLGQSPLSLDSEGTIMGVSYGIGFGAFGRVADWFGIDTSLAYRALSGLGTGEGRAGRSGSGSGVCIRLSPVFTF